MIFGNLHLFSHIFWSANTPKTTVDLIALILTLLTSIVTLVTFRIQETLQGSFFCFSFWVTESRQPRWTSWPWPCWPQLWPVRIWPCRTHTARRRAMIGASLTQRWRDVTSQSFLHRQPAHLSTLEPSYGSQQSLFFLEENFPKSWQLFIPTKKNVRKYPRIMRTFSTKILTLKLGVHIICGYICTCVGMLKNTTFVV